MAPLDSAAQAAAPHCAGLCAGVRFPNCRGASELINYAAHLPHLEQTDTMMKSQTSAPTKRTSVHQVAPEVFTCGVHLVHRVT
jgi:hypothetical protein